MIDQGSSELNVIVGVNEEDFEQAIRCILLSMVKVSLPLKMKIRIFTILEQAISN